MVCFKQILSSRRKYNKLTLRKLSQLTGISVSYLSEIENGVKLPPKNESKIKQIAKALQYDHKKLMDLAQKERIRKTFFNMFEKLFIQDKEFALALCYEAIKKFNKIGE